MNDYFQSRLLSKKKGSFFYNDACYYIIFLILILVTNIFFFAPHNNDFPGLAAICNVMNENIEFCVNNNWGFMVPLTTHLLNLLTNNILLAQRILAGLECLFLIYSLLYIMKREGFSGYHKIVSLTLFAISPWFFDSILSLHFDVVAISIILLFTYKALKDKDHLFLYGFIVGVSFWFRFHFLAYCIMFPLIIYISTRSKRSLMQAGLGVLASLAIPHILTFMVYHQFSLSNQKFVIAQFLGSNDWSYEFARELKEMSYLDIINQSDVLYYLKKNIFDFMNNILFLCIIVSFVDFKRIIKDKKTILILSIIIFIVFFLFIRGAKYRLTLGIFVPVLLLIPDMKVNTISKKILVGVSLILFLLSPQIKLIRRYYNKIQEHHMVYEKISQNIDLENTSSNDILALGDMYNFSDEYLEYSQVIQDGWIVRFEPVVKRYELVDIHNIYRKDVIDKINQFKYIIQKKNDYNYKSLNLSKHHKLVHSDDILDIFEYNEKLMSD